MFVSVFLAIICAWLVIKYHTQLWLLTKYIANAFFQALMNLVVLFGILYCLDYIGLGMPTWVYVVFGVFMFVVPFLPQAWQEKMKEVAERE